MIEKPAGIPLEALLTSPGFERNCEILLSEPVGLTDNKLRAAITSLVVSGAVTRAESKRRASATNTDNAKSLRKDVTREALETFRQQYMIVMQTKCAWPLGSDHGWKAEALKSFHMTRKTLDARWKNK